ncbi:MAG TPA: hypothetical protein VJN88_11185 [Ktedonobacterales bacterium]|nr:hypothetical protein [Ktedonobacterales bacterium]
MASYRAQPPAQPQPAPSAAANDATMMWVGLGSSFLGVVCAVLAYLKGDQSSQKVALAVAVFAFIVLALWIWRLLAQPQPRYDPYAYGTQYGVGPDGLPRPATPDGGAPAPRPYMPVAPAAPLYSQEALQQTPMRAAEPNPFINDPLFMLEAPAKNVRRFILPKDPDRMCEDGFACDAAHGVYAVTDGVSQSFVSAPWARIVARGFARQPEAFNDEASFTAWLETRATEWRDWMTNTWMATLNEQRQKRGERPGDWSGDIEDKGAQATLVGLALRRSGKQMEARVLAIGDSQFLLFHRDGKAGYHLRGAFPLEKPEDFSLNPATLLTRRDPRLAAFAWSKRLGTRIPLQSGDVVVLATDSVAKWLMTQALREQRPAPVEVAGPTGDPTAVGAAGDPTATGADPTRATGRLDPFVDDWSTMLTTRDQAEFERLTHREIHAGRMDEDDVTVVVIPID